VGRLALLLVATAALSAQGGVVAQVRSRHWPNGTPAFSRPNGVAACRAEMKERGPVAARCSKGARFEIRNGARVVVTTVDGDSATVTVMDGPHAGEVGVVASEELEAQRAGGPRPDPTRPVTLNGTADANARARIRTAGAARARCLDSCLLRRCPDQLTICEDACRKQYERAVR
jgi:hypothetical protein